MTSYPVTHPAVVATAKRQPLTIREVPTETPEADEVVVRVQWTASSPLDLHQADGGIAATFPFILGCSFAGVIVASGANDSVEQGPNALKIGDRVFGFTWEKQKQQGFQTYITVPRHMMGLIPENLSPQEAVTAPANLVCAFHTITHDIGLELPWPLPRGWKSEAFDKPILIWGAASSVGLYSIQVLSHWGYTNVLAVASKKHHDELKALGATKCFDYREKDVVEQILAQESSVPSIIDCIGHVDGTARPITKIAKSGSKVAIMMPAILRDATEEVEPLYSMDAQKFIPDEWAEGVERFGTRTFFYEKNEFFKQHMQPEIVPVVLGSGIIKPNRARVVEGETLLERAQKALDLLRQRAPSGERLVWRVSEE